MADYSTTSLLSSIKTRGMIPASQRTFSDTDILALATEELRLGVAPFVMKNRSDYFVTSTDSSIVSGQDTYSIPTRAMGGKLKGVYLVDSSGNFFDFPQIDKGERSQYNFPSTNQTFVFYFEGNNVVIVPNPTSSPGLSIRFSYYCRPSALVPIANAAQISSVGANSVVVSAVPSTMTTNTSVDLVKGRPGFECRAQEMTIQNVVGTTVTFTANVPSSLVAGDWVCLAEESPLPQVPVELHPMLAQRTVIKILEALGDQSALQSAQGKLREMEEGALHLLSPRTDSNPRKLVNPYSPLRSR